jgi:hypothetical protein
MRWTAELGCGLLVALAARQGLASEDEAGTGGLSSAASAAAAPWSLGATVGIAGNSYTAGGYGYTVETNRVAFAGLSLAPTYQLTPSVALALQVGLGLGLGDAQLVADHSQTVAELALAARYQGQLWDGWYVSGRGGAAAIRERVGEQQATQWAPLAGFAAGHDFRVAAALSLGIELCGVHTWFGERGHTFQLEPANVEGPSVRFGYGGTTWFGLNLTGRVLL